MNTTCSSDSGKVSTLFSLGVGVLTPYRLFTAWSEVSLLLFSDTDFLIIFLGLDTCNFFYFF